LLSPLLADTQPPQFGINLLNLWSDVLQRGQVLIDGQALGG
jgi:hypothetical protein